MEELKQFGRKQVLSIDKTEMQNKLGFNRIWRKKNHLCGSFIILLNICIFQDSTIHKWHYHKKFYNLCRYNLNVNGE